MAVQVAWHALRRHHHAVAAVGQPWCRVAEAQHRGGGGRPTTMAHHTTAAAASTVPPHNPAANHGPHSLDAAPPLSPLADVAARLRDGDRPSEARVAAAVTAFLKLPEEEQAATLAATAAHASLIAPAVATSSSAAVPFLLAVRRSTAAAATAHHHKHDHHATPASGHGGGGGEASHAASSDDGRHRAWHGAWDGAAVAMLRPLFGPACIHTRQLSVNPAAGSDMVALVEGAVAGETVHRPDSRVLWLRKFGPHRMVHASVHHHAPDTLLAVLYSALLPAWPASLAAVDADSGGPPPPAGFWHPTTGPAPAQAHGGGMTTPTVATFYSVSAPHPAARGLRLATRLIYGVAAQIASAVPSITLFTTLSPIPAFTAWVRHRWQRGGGTVASDGGAWDFVEVEAMAAGASALGLGQDVQGHTPQHALAAIAAVADWSSHAAAIEALKPVLLREVVAYLAPATRGGCAVAAFHRSNGAVLRRICWGADPSPTGMARSCGIMANYVYSDNGAAGLAATTWSGGERRHDTMPPPPVLVV